MGGEIFVFTFFTVSLSYWKKKPTIITKTKSIPYEEPDSPKVKSKEKKKPELLNTLMNNTFVFHLAENFTVAKGYSFFPLNMPIENIKSYRNSSNLQVTQYTSYFLAICNTIFACNYKLLAKN